MVFFTTSRWTSFVIASVVLPSSSMANRALACLTASIVCVAREGDVQRVRAVPVEDGGDLVGTAQAARGALAELGAGGGDELDLGHVYSPGADVGAVSLTWRCDGVACAAEPATRIETGVVASTRDAGRARGGARPVDHGAQVVVELRRPSFVPRRGNLESLPERAARNPTPSAGQSCTRLGPRPPHGHRRRTRSADRPRRARTWPSRRPSRGPSAAARRRHRPRSPTGPRPAGDRPAWPTAWRARRRPPRRPPVRARAARWGR